MFSEFLSQNLIWVGAFVIVANLWVWSFLQSKVKGVGTVSALGLPALQRGGNSVIIDVNDESQFNTAHLPDAINMPLGDLNADNKALMKLQDKRVILVCQTGSRSSGAARKLLSLGFKDIHILGGGLMSWTKENLPVSNN